MNYAQQQCKFRGMVVDSLDIPIYDASISAFNENNEGVGYTFSDKEGEFMLELPCDKKYELEVEHLSYNSLVYKVNLDKSKRERIEMSPNKVNLKEIIAQGRVPIKVKGDTIEYDADSFKTGQEENLEDILKKLPGIQVEDGKVYYQGKQINSIKVEGREIFGGNTKLLTKNLPSEAVDKIQLNKKFKANPFANSLQDEEQPELNIVLKEDKKNLIFGNTTVGGDADTHYDLQEKLFRFSRKTDATLISDFNTYGKEVFSSEDYFQFLGGLSEYMEEGGSNALRNSMSSVMFGTGQNATEMKNNLGALHLGYEPNDRLYLTSFAMATDNTLKYKSTTNRIYNDFTVNDVNENDQSIFAFISRLKLNYSINDRSDITYRVNFNTQENENNQNNESFFNESPMASSFRKTYSDKTNYNLNQRFSYIRKVGEDDNFGLYLTHQYQKEIPDWNLNIQPEDSLGIPFNGLFTLVPQDSLYNLNQTQKLKSNTLQGLAIYNHLITNLSNIRFKLGGNVNASTFNNTISSFQDVLQDPNAVSDADFKYGEYFLDATYTRKIGEFKMDAGVSVNYFKVNNSTPTAKSEFNFWRLFPHLKAEYKFSSNQRLNFNYDLTNEIPQIKELTPAYQIQNYYSLYTGNPNLSEAQFHKLNLSYSYYNFYKFFTLYTGLSYNRRVKGIRTANFIDAFNQIDSPINVPNPENNFSANVYVSKRFTKKYSLKFNGSANLSDYTTYSAFTQSPDFEENPSKSNSYFGQITNTFKLKKKVELDLGFKYLNSSFTNRFNDNTFNTYSPFATLAWVVTDKILLQSDYTLSSQYNNGDLLNNNNDWNASIRIKPYKKLYVYFIGGNLLNNNEQVSSSFSNNFTSITNRQLLGRYFLATVKFKF